MYIQIWKNFSLYIFQNNEMNHTLQKHIKDRQERNKEQEKTSSFDYSTHLPIGLKIFPHHHG